MTVEVFYVMCPQSYCKQNTPPSHLRNGCCCVLDSAGGFRKLPLQEKRPRTCHPGAKRRISNRVQITKQFVILSKAKNLFIPFAKESPGTSSNPSVCHNSPLCRYPREGYI